MREKIDCFVCRIDLNKLEDFPLINPPLEVDFFLLDIFLALSESLCWLTFSETEASLLLTFELDLCGTIFSGEVPSKVLKPLVNI
mmetsp:Transcript_103414/g.182239  ORF Transcript_103414/g.182239 Transcript_103414/m.182239 type:complete len:85 (+) Transcript_103414:20-274(+)